MKIRHFILSLGLIGLAAGVTGCKDDDKAVTGVALDKSSITIDPDAITNVIPYPIPWDALVNEKFSFSSENTAVAKVNSKGQVLGVNPGTTNITCTYQNFSKTIPVTVTPIVSLKERINQLGAKGFWEFEGSNAQKATIGNDMIFVNGHKAITTLAGPRSDDGAIRIPRDPGADGTFIKCLHGMAAKGGEKVNEYTVMWDIRLPDEAGMPESGYYSLMSTRTLTNTQDQDFAIKRNGNFGIGGMGYCPEGTLVKGKWQRVVLTMKAGVAATYYCDGAKVYDGDISAAPVDGRYSMLTSGVLFFSDEDGDDSTIDACSVAIWDRALSGDEVKTLGSVRQAVDFDEN